MSADDPVADFLARESEQMVGLEDDLPIPVKAEEGSFDAASPESEGPDEIKSEADEFNADEFLGRGQEEPAPVDFGAAIPAPDQPRMQPSPVNLPRIEPEKIRKWREEQKIRLEHKDEEEVKKKEEWKVKAKKELEDWYKNRADTLEKAKKANRSAEEDIIRDRDSLTPGQEWERIGKLCEFNPKNSKNTKDVTRMRALLLQLKTGQKAE